MKFLYKGYFGPDHDCGTPNAGDSWADDFNFFKTASLVSTEKVESINIRLSAVDLTNRSRLPVGNGTDRGCDSNA